MMKQGNKKGFTLVETITVLAIVGVFMCIFSTLFFLNWQVCNQFIARADFGQDMDQAIDQIANDGRYSREIDVANSATATQATFLDPSDNVLGVYTMFNNGEMTVTRGGNVEIMSEQIDYPDSSFTKDGDAVVVNMAMHDDILGHTVSLNSQTEIYPRNLPSS